MKNNIKNRIRIEIIRCVACLLILFALTTYDDIDKNYNNSHLKNEIVRLIRNNSLQKNIERNIIEIMVSIN